MVLTRSQAQRFYDRFGKKQDAQAFYEDAALDDLIAHAARRLTPPFLPPQAPRTIVRADWAPLRIMP
jgi:hypothetical protein